jgi:hypothetical protein
VKGRIPEIRKGAEKPTLNASISGAYKIKKDDLRPIVKAINPMSDITKYEVFFYPVWKVRLGNRELTFDGITGRQVVLF